MVNIVVACDKTYYDKAEILFNSLDKNAKGFRKQILCIGFEVEREGYEAATVKIEDLKSYRKGFPSNRPFYICAEGGEFLDYFDYKDDDIIIHIDADMVMQRLFDESELQYLIYDCLQGFVIGSPTSKPVTTFREEYWRLKPKLGYVKTKEAYNNLDWSEPIICAGLIIASVKTYREVIYKGYLGGVDKMIQHFDHHAAGQWLMNYVIKDKVVFYNNELHCGEWFLDIKTGSKDNKLTVNDKVVLFNHTKFIKDWNY